MQHTPQLKAECHRIIHSCFSADESALVSDIRPAVIIVFILIGFHKLSFFRVMEERQQISRHLDGGFRRFYCCAKRQLIRCLGVYIFIIADLIGSDPTDQKTAKCKTQDRKDPFRLITKKCFFLIQKCSCSKQDKQEKQTHAVWSKPIGQCYLYLTVVDRFIGQKCDLDPVTTVGNIGNTGRDLWINTAVDRTCLFPIQI